VLAQTDRQWTQADQQFYKEGWNWGTVAVMVFLHLGAIAALFAFNWRAFLSAVFLYWMCTGLGISLGYHRLHTHRSYKTSLLVEYFFAVCGALTLEGGPIFWVATHRIHHQNSDQPGDPHSPRDGAWWSHVGWILIGESKHNNTRLMSKYSPDLAKHRFYVWLNNWHWVPSVVLGGILFAIGGLPMLLWGGFFRIVFGLHATWLINSATHMWGARRFDTRDDSRNNFLIALVSFGEGWHNNHHAHPTSARHGLAWWEFDFSWITLKILRALRVVSKVQVASVKSRLLEKEAA
jgi:stearoyl-CoA desaturase (Delta-9 desaturase)